MPRRDELPRLADFLEIVCVLLRSSKLERVDMLCIDELQGLCSWLPTTECMFFF